ncbi:hypothetical protein CSPX01_14086 [Colletotrichum filicis]|nr:hypothetical protein CSPX01_14086 [Colletotrichum filicis]
MISLAPSYLTSHNCVLCTPYASGRLYPSCTVCTHLEHKFTFCHRGRSCNGQDRLHNSSLPQTQAGRAKADQKTPRILLQQDTRPLHPPSCSSHLFRALCSLHPPFQCRYSTRKKNNPLGSPCDSQLDEHRSTGILSVS